MTAAGPSDVKARLLATARRAGAGAVRVCDAASDGEAEERFANAIARGDVATWPYDRAYAAAATAPASLLDDARSVVCIAVPFATQAPSRRAPLSGRVSNYAWGADYHGIVRGVLEAVRAQLDEAAGGPASRIVCDTAPLAERAFAARSGVGWVGKHTNVIAPGLGSFVFLGEVVTSVELPADPPLRKSCGACSRCVEACPTGALRGDYTMDATRCISDLTQRRDGIPRDLRALVGDWVWGCDLCQDVCPPTQQAKPSVPAAFGARSTSDAFVDVQRLLRTGSRACSRSYRHSAMAWRGATVLRRNAAVALGNALDRSAVASLEDALRDDRSAMVRGHAAWALGRIGSPRALSALAQAAAVECSPDVRAEIADALEPFVNRRAFETPEAEG